MTTSEKDDVEASAAPLLDHLIELRRRIIHSLVVFFVAFVVCFFVKDYALQIVLYPYQWAMKISGGDVTKLRLQSTDPWETLLTQMKLSAFLAVVIVFPYIAMQIYRFIAPGLYKNERMAFLPFLVVAPALFIIGAAFVYFVISPMILWFSLSLQFLPNPDLKVEFNPKISTYLSFIISLMLIFGLVFQLPLATSLMTKAGLITSKMLTSKRKWAVLISFIIASIVTPGDLLTLFGLVVPMLLLYEISILFARRIEKKRARMESQA